MITKIDNEHLHTPFGDPVAKLVDMVNDYKLNRTLISHEVPLGLLEMSRWFNDYDYALVHLFNDYPQYFDFYKKSVEMGRMVILDNSLYELGEAFDMREYDEWISKLQPTHYIIPDTFWDSQATINQAMRWMVGWGQYIDPKIKKIGVAQGATYEEIKRSYQFMDSIGCDVIAFTFKFSPEMENTFVFDGAAFEDYILNTEISYPGATISNEDLKPEDKQAILRCMLLRKLDEEGIINKNKPHHLLGLQNTTALRLTCAFPWVRSIDTSNPIITGYLEIPYDFNHECICVNPAGYPMECNYIGNSGREKPAFQLKDIFEKCVPGTPDYANCINIIKHNVRAFREIVNPSDIDTVNIFKNKDI